MEMYLNWRCSATTGQLELRNDAVLGSGEQILAGRAGRGVVEQQGAALVGPWAGAEYGSIYTARSIYNRGALDAK